MHRGGSAFLYLDTTTYCKFEHYPTAVSSSANPFPSKTLFITELLEPRKASIQKNNYNQVDTLRCHS